MTTPKSKITTVIVLIPAPMTGDDAGLLAKCNSNINRRVAEDMEFYIFTLCDSAVKSLGVIKCLN
jgi:hypothetical protein